MFLMDQAMAGASGGGAQDGPSFDASLAEALQDGAKKVGENLKRVERAQFRPGRGHEIRYGESRSSWLRRACLLRHGSKCLPMVSSSFAFEADCSAAAARRKNAGAELGIPMDVVPAAHLIFEKPREQQALRAGRFHHQRIREDVHVCHEVVEHGSEIGRSGHGDSASIDICA